MAQLRFPLFFSLMAALGLAGLSPAHAQPTGFEALEDVGYWRDLCRLQAAAGEYEDAQAACEQAIALAPEEADIWAQHSGILVNLEAFPDAIASANRSLSFDPENSLAITYQCVSYTALGETEMALDKCNDALRVNGSWGSENPALAWRYRGQILAQAQQHDMALVAYERTLLLEPDDSQTLTRQCEAYVALARSRDAIETCTAALDSDQQWGDLGPAIAWTYQGQAHSQLHQHNEAIFAYDQAISLDPNNALTWTAQGQVLDQLGRNAEALVSYNRAVAIKADYSQALLGQCTLHNRLQTYEIALPACDAAIDGDGNWQTSSLAKAWNERSIALTGLGEFDEALATINRAVGIQPDYIAAHNHRGTILWYLGHYLQALEANQQALNIDDTYAPAWFNRGVILRAMGRYEQSLAAYDEALALNPFNAWGWTNHSVILWQLEAYTASLQSAQQAIALAPESPSAWYNKGTALSALGRHRDAVIAYNQVVALDETHSDALTGRGVAQVHLGDDESAMADLQAALALNPEDSLAQSTLVALAERAAEP